MCSLQQCLCAASGRNWQVPAGSRRLGQIDPCYTGGKGEESSLWKRCQQRTSTCKCRSRERNRGPSNQLINSRSRQIDGQACGTAYCIGKRVGKHRRLVALDAAEREADPHRGEGAKAMDLAKRNQKEAAGTRDENATLPRRQPFSQQFETTRALVVVGGAAVTGAIVGGLTTALPVALLYLWTEMSPYCAPWGSLRVSRSTCS